MGFFRNPEIKQSLKIHIVLAISASALGMVFGAETAAVALLTSILFSFLHFIITYRRYKKIARLADVIDRVLHNQETLELNEYSEGELAILQNQILKMTVRLREQALALKQDKVFLADSIADISHQIRTPLTSINLILSMLSQPDITEERRQQYIRELETLAVRIDWLITALLKIARLDAGTVKFQKDTVYVSDLIKKATSTLAVQMDVKGQRLEVALEGGEKFTGDISWSAEAVENILKNCMEHTPSGGSISISASENALYTEIVIKDSGSGIAKEDMPHIFERFYKGRNSSGNSFGIGLALARMIIVNQNGTIKAGNCKEGGARFEIRFYKGTI